MLKIVFEGMDCSGKTTEIAKLKQDMVLDLYVQHFPIQDIHEHMKQSDPIESIISEMENCKYPDGCQIAVLDRYWPSTMVYQFKETSIPALTDIALMFQKRLPIDVLYYQTPPTFVEWSRRMNMRGDDFVNCDVGTYAKYRCRYYNVISAIEETGKIPVYHSSDKDNKQTIIERKLQRANISI
jgi:thymidylate kinase